MAQFLLCHRHEPSECRFAFAAWRGFDSPLRHRATVCSCASGGHTIWWQVEAADRRAAIAQLPAYLARTAEAVEISGVEIP